VLKVVGRNGREWNNEANILANLAEWKPKEQPFYLELYGETSPLVDEAYAEVVPAGGTDSRATGRRQCTNIGGHLGILEHQRSTVIGSKTTAISARGKR